MSTITFHKYQATGNDFIMIDNREKVFPKENLTLIEQLCDRKFGIGSDGLILIEQHNKVDFNMVFYNPDGSQSLCGNGSRCAVNFAKEIGVIDASETTFMAYDGVHSATIKGNLVELSMNNVQNVSQLEDGIFVDTGSPHFVRFVEHVHKVEIIPEGSKIRYSDAYQPAGTNVNFVQQLGDQQIFVRTYERGVENETLSCGTGVTGAALAASTLGLKAPISVTTKGGELTVNYKQMDDGSFEGITLCGPAQMVYAGSIKINM
jgi:diaminopimelate epimerase